VSARPSAPGDESPGTLTSLVNEVFRGSPTGDRNDWVDGLAPGTALGRYDLIREVGRGGFGVVWEARDRELGRRVALKVIRVRRSGVPEKRLVAEAEVAARLSHPGIVTILDVGRNDRGGWLVQEFLTGRTLNERLEEGALSLRETLRVGMDVARALAHAHANGVVHRDLTARNVFLCEDGQVKLLDLGMAQAFGQRKLEGGTPDYMAPEQARGAPEDERVDVYSLGVLLYRMIAGESPVPAEGIAEGRPAPRLDIPELPGLGELIGHMLAPDPMDRPRDAAVVLAELDALALTLPRTGTGTRPGAVRVRKRWPRWAIAAAALVVPLITAGAGALAARRWLAPAPDRLLPLAFGATESSIGCSWGRATWYDLDRLPEGAFTRNGEMGGQGVAEVGGRKAWKVTSDWGQLVVPLGLAARGDPFAIEVEFLMPPLAGWMRGANLHAFTDPVGGNRTGEIAHGVTLAVLEEPGKPPRFEWYEPDGRGGVRNRYLGTLPGPISGKWHTLRIEGSPSKGWYRGLLDGRPLVVARGEYDLSGAHVSLGAGYGYMNPKDVSWSNLRTFAGTPECQ
jgi:hypothetical protein